MGQILPFRQRQRTGRTPARATRPTNWFPFVLVALPLAAFTAVLMLPATGGPPEAEAAAGPEPLSLAGDPWGFETNGPEAQTVVDASVENEQAQFPICDNGRRVTCVVDGDTIWLRGVKIRIADIDTPEVTNPGCAQEAQLGEQATLRMQTLLNAGAFSVEPNPDGRDSDDYGRKLRVVSRDGESLGETLVREGLATRWGGPRVGWC